MSKFKVGDRVRVLPFGQVEDHYCIKHSHWNSCADKEFTVSSVGNTYVNLTGDPYSWPLEGLEKVTNSDEHLPKQFKLNPNGNEALSKAMQERLFELGYAWICFGKEVQPDCLYFSVGLSEPNKIYFNDIADAPTLTLDDLYRLTPAPKELPKLEIAGRTLELKDGKVVGPEFGCDLDMFLADLTDLLDNGRHFGRSDTRILSVKIGCQTVVREELHKARDWANGLSKA